MRKRLLIGLLVLIALGAPAAYFAKPTVHWLKEWRALQLSQESAQAMRAGDLATAEQRSQAAVSVWQFDPRVLRQFATVENSINPEKAVRLWQLTWQYSGDPADRRELVLAAMAVRDYSYALEQFTALAKQDPDNPQTWFVEARLRLSQGQWDLALPLLRRVLDHGDAPEDAHILFAQATQFSPDASVREEGLDYLRKLSTRSDQLGLRSLRVLTTFQAQSLPDIEQLAQHLRDHPQATRDDKLLALRLLLSLPGADETALIGAAHDLFNTHDPNELAQLGHWLIDLGKDNQVLKYVDNEVARSREDLFEIRLDALAGLNQWQLVADAINQPDNPLPKELQMLFQARVLTEQGHGPRADLAWESMVLKVADDPKKLLNVAAYATKLGLFDYAQPALDRLVKDPTERYHAYELIIMAEQHNKDTVKLHQTLADMYGFYPTDPAVHNDDLFTGFLLGQAEPAQIAAAQKLVNDNPTMLSYRVTLALGLLKAGRPAEAQNVFQGLNINWRSVSYSWQTVFVALMRAAGTKDAGTIAYVDETEKNIPRQSLLPEEAALLSPPAAAATGK